MTGGPPIAFTPGPSAAQWLAKQAGLEVGELCSGGYQLALTPAETTAGGWSTRTPISVAVLYDRPRNQLAIAALDPQAYWQFYTKPLYEPGRVGLKPSVWDLVKDMHHQTAKKKVDYTLLRAADTNPRLYPALT